MFVKVATAGNRIFKLWALDAHAGVVFCEGDGMQPFVVWNYAPNEDGSINCSGGHYFGNFTQAMEFYTERTLSVRGLSHI